MNYIGDFAEDSTVRIALTTNDGSGGAVAPSSAFEVADFRVYKNGSATQKTSDNGMTITSPFDSVTGLHTLEIDTSNDTGDSGFWTTGADYWVVAVPDETVDSQTVVQVVASFSIENRIRVKATDEVSANVTKISGSAVSTSTAQLGVNVVNAGGTAWGSGAITDGVIASNAITSAKLATDCITSAQLASTAITEIQSGLATTANVAAVETDTQDIQSRLPAALVGGRIDANVGAISSDSVAADNAEAFFDGTGYAGTGNVIPTVTTVTNRVSANTDQIAGVAVSTTTAQIGVNVVNAGGTAWGSGAITAAAIASNAITSAKIAANAIGASQIASNAITSAKIAADAIGASQLAANAITSSELDATAITAIQSGLATAANVSAVETDTQDIQARLPAALVSGRMDASVGAMQANTLSASALATDAVEEIADAVLTESVLDHNSVNNSLAKFIWQIRNANLTIDGTVSNAITPTTLTFSSNVSATTSAYAHAVLLFISGPLAGENSPIISYNSTNGVFVLEESLTAAPSDGDEFVVIAGSHVHAIADIQSGLATTAQLTTVESKVDAIDNFVDTEVAAIKATTDKLDTTVELDGAVYRFTTNALEQAPSGGGGGTGTGARTVTITVDDGTNPLENARVRVTSGAETYVTSTDVSGVATFNLDDATWVVSITKPGYTFAGTSLVVDGTETVTYSMSLVVITPSNVDKVTGYWTVLDETGSAAASVVVTIKARQPLRGGAGIIHDAGERTATSNGSGLVQFTNLIPGWRYAVVANDDYVADFVVPADAVTSVELGSIVARLP